ncbi:aminoacetone oxidase family FAD-binding enzyme [Denitratisoma sp. DHT3]|uniref:TIGR03862 family flavoprotein n=1 Tax=Denitratisoma sp. DHT3 TaxID=1981880 RepID=UPI00119894EA|nr:TIGR03862 family flavoprotein [Denitratisoma sp. DHT3]QDX80261.1 aminoacetone oxidase family FAD-binding enzyme [Denitratisoma sp. DHT3]
MTADAVSSSRVAIVGGGPAGLMAAEGLAAAGLRVDLYDAMPSVGRKFLMAGKGGLNLTHAEAAPDFLARYGARSGQVAPWLAAFGPDALREWARELGTETFVGSSGRVFPVDMKAAPLLRAWLHRLRRAGVGFHMRHRWLGWVESRLCFATPQGERQVEADAVVLALGGGSWRQLGSDGAWVPLLARRGVDIAPLLPANCGFDVVWSEHFRERFAGQPVKSVTATFIDREGICHQRSGEFVVTATGVEGSLIYALSAPLRDALEAGGTALLRLDLAPGKSLERIEAEVSHPRGARSMASHLQSKAGIAGVKAGLLRECTVRETYADPVRLAAAIKDLHLVLQRPRPLDEAISSAGGVRFEALTPGLMLRALPGVFCAGEMLDWEAPTGGYLLTACFASGRAAAAGVVDYLRRPATRTGGMPEE